MEEFIKEVKSIPTNELIIIIEDQEELYSKEEFEILKKELESRNEVVNESKINLINEVMEDFLDEAIENEIEEEKRNEERKIIEEIECKKRLRELTIQKLKEKGFEEYCEYKVLKLSDSYGGSFDTKELEEMLNFLALDGWRIKISYTNELGINSSMIRFGGVSTGSNSTSDEHIIILERITKI